MKRSLLLSLLLPILASAAEVPLEPNAVGMPDGHPLTAVVVTQCNLIVAVYFSWAPSDEYPNGRLTRVDVTSQKEIAAPDLLALAYTASFSERVEVSCENVGLVGTESHSLL